MRDTFSLLSALDSPGLQAPHVLPAPPDTAGPPLSPGRMGSFGSGEEPTRVFFSVTIRRAHVTTLSRALLANGPSKVRSSPSPESLVPRPSPRACAPPGHKDRPLFPSGLRPEWAVQVQEEPVWLVLRRNGGGQAPVGPGSSPDRKPEQPATLFLGLLCRTHPSSGCSGEGVRPDAGEKQFWYPDRSFPESHSRLVGGGPGSYAWHSSS